MSEYEISNVPTLIDINKSSTYFTATYRARAVNGEAFNIAIASQSDLDNQTVAYIPVKGETEGKYDNTSGEYQNFFLVLKTDSETPIKVIVDIKATEIETKVSGWQSEECRTTVKWALIIGGISLVVGLGYFLYNRSSNEKKYSPPPVLSPKPTTYTEYRPSFRRQSDDILNSVLKLNKE